MSETLRRVLVLLGLAVAGVVCGRVLVSVLTDDPGGAGTRASTDAPEITAPASGAPRSPRPQGSAAARDPTSRAVSVLRSWDERRATAYAQGDLTALRGLYAPGSEAGAADLRVLRQYADRGLVVRGMRSQYLSVEVLAAGRDRVRLRVAERVVGATAVGERVRQRLPVPAVTTRVVTLERPTGRWRVVGVRSG